MNKRAKLLGSIVAKAAARSILDNYDFTYLSILMDEILDDNDIVSVEVKEQKGKEFTFAHSDHKPHVSSSVIVSSISNRTDEIGKVRILYTYDNIRRKLLGHIVVLLIVQAAVFLTLTMLIRYFFRKVLGSKINRIGHVIEEVKGGDLSTRINYRNVDEIGVIANGFDFLVDHLGATVDKMRAISLKLSRSVDHVNQTLQNMVETAGDQQLNSNSVFKSLNDASLSQQHIIENTNNLFELSQVTNESLDNIKTTFNGVVENIDSLNNNTGSLYSSISELSNSSRDVASLAERAAESVREASLTMESIYSSVEQIDHVVKESTALSVEVTEIISGKGISSVTSAIDTMGRIELFFNSLSGTISQLDTRSKDVAKILAVIQDVTEQAHLLSLNAQIIAAQSGENGKSFAVVANEMKLLAVKTSLSAKEIEEIIQTIQHEIKSAVTATAETSQNVRQGKSVVAGAGEVLSEILDASRNSTEMMKSIAVATVEQNRLLGTVLNDINILRNLNEKVKIATGEEEKSTAYLVNGISAICDSMGETRRATEVQACMLEVIAENMEISNKQTGEIAAASIEQRKVNDATIASMIIALQTGNDMLMAVEGVTTSIGGVYRELERLQGEMKFFRIGVDIDIPLSDAE